MLLAAPRASRDSGIVLGHLLQEGGQRLAAVVAEIGFFIHNCSRLIGCQKLELRSYPFGMASLDTPIIEIYWVRAGALGLSVGLQSVFWRQFGHTTCAF